MAANHVLDEKKAADKTEFRQLDLFTDFTEVMKRSSRMRRLNGRRRCRRQCFRLRRSMEECNSEGT